MLLSGVKAFFPLIIILITHFCMEIDSSEVENQSGEENDEADSLELVRDNLQEDYHTGVTKMIEFFNLLDGSLLKINQRLNSLQSEENRKSIISASINSSLEKVNERINALERAGVQRHQEILEKISLLMTKKEPITGSIKTKNFNCFLTIKGSTLRCSSTIDENWLIEEVNDGFYTLIHLCSGSALGMIPSATQSYHYYQKINLTSRDSAKSDPRYHWSIQLYRGSQTLLKFINRATKLTLDSNGQIIYHHAVNDGEFQVWQFQKTSPFGSCFANQG